MSAFVQKLAMDFGQTYVRLALHDTKEITEELQSKLFLSFQRSRFKLGKNNQRSQSFSDMYDRGQIKNQELFAEYLRFILARAGLGKFAFARIELLLSVATDTSKATKQIWIKVFEQIGVSKVTFVSSPICGAVGAGYAFPIPTVALVVHLGHSSSEIAAVSLHECLFSSSLTFSIENLSSRMKSRYFSYSRQEMSPQEWGKIEATLGHVLLQPTKSLTIPEAIILEESEHLIQDIVIALEKLSIEELSLCTSQGILLIGGLARQEGIAQFLAQRLSIPVYSAGDAETAVIRGGASLLQFLESEEGV